LADAVAQPGGSIDPNRDFWLSKLYVAVTPAAAEPIVGWSDNIHGPAGFGMGILKGIVRGFYIDKDVNLKTIPVDAVVKILITSAWHRGTNQKLR